MELHTDQYPPTWGIWGMSAGRGAGKTEAAVQWIHSYANSETIRIVIVVPSTGNIAEMAERFTAEFPDVTWKPSIRRLEWEETGSKAFLTTSNNPYSLRGAQSHVTFLDDVQDFAKEGPDQYNGGRTNITTLDEARLVTRLGRFPRLILTHTPDFPKPWPEESQYTMDSDI